MIDDIQNEEDLFLMEELFHYSNKNEKNIRGECNNIRNRVIKNLSKLHQYINGYVLEEAFGSDEFTFYDYSYGGIYLGDIIDTSIELNNAQRISLALIRQNIYYGFSSLRLLDQGFYGPGISLIRVILENTLICKRSNLEIVTNKKTTEELLIKWSKNELYTSKLIRIYILNEDVLHKNIYAKLNSLFTYLHNFAHGSHIRGQIYFEENNTLDIDYMKEFYLQGYAFLSLLLLLNIRNLIEYLHPTLDGLFLFDGEDKLVYDLLINELLEIINNGFVIDDLIKDNDQGIRGVTSDFYSMFIKENRFK